MDAQCTIDRETVLVVDDTPDNLALLTSLLRERYRVKVAVSGEKALSIASSDDPPDIILLDIMMPGMDGHEVCRALKTRTETAAIPVIFLTAKSDVEDEKAGFELGAVDYITKPISPPIVLARVKNHLLLKNVRDFLHDKSMYLEEEVERRVREVAALQDATIIALGSMTEARDNETGNHLRRTQNCVKLLAEHLSGHPAFCGLLTPGNVDLIFKSAPLHDIGKAGIPDSVLHKGGRLTTEEREMMKEHTRIGRDAILAVESLVDAPASFLRFAREIAGSHHEKWDGTGYPDGLRGDEIPVSARLVAIADTYDTLVSHRPGRQSFPHEGAVSMIKGEGGLAFDPDMVIGFCQIADRFRAVAERFPDPPAEVV